PEPERKPGVVEVPDLKQSERLIPAPPEGGLVLRVHARFLTRDGKDGLRYARTEDFLLMGKTAEARRPYLLFLQPNTEYLWLTEKECKSLVPADPRKGDEAAVAPAIVDRLVRFHLTPRRATTSEGGILGKRDVKSAKLTLTVEDVTARRVRLRLKGFVH